MPYAIFLVLFVALPLILIILYAFQDGSGNFTFGNFTKFFTDADAIGTFALSLEVAIENTLRMELSLAEKGVPFESHIYAYGGHGFSTAEDWINTNSVCPRLPHWVPDSVEWLGEVLGKLTRGGFTEPTSAGSMNGDFAPVLSVDCTLSHLRRQSDDARAVLAPMFEGIEAVAKAREFPVEGLMAAIGNNTAREILEMVQTPSDTITEIDRALHGMVNELEA